MKIALIGYGKMGHMVEDAVQKKGHIVIARIGSKGAINLASIGNADVCIDFSHPNCAIDNIKQMSALGKNVVVGTTGWYDEIDKVKAIVKESRIGCLYSPNFSLGVHLFLQIVSQAAILINHFDDYDVGII